LESRYQFILGKSLAFIEGRQDDAEAMLSKSIKLDPSNIDAWNSLAHCHWKRGKGAQAKAYFLGALEVQRNAITLQNLSMLLRHLPSSSPQEQCRNIKKSLALAKEAVTVTKGDGKSWYNLANAYLAVFFQGSQDPTDLDRSLKAYSKADSLGEGKTNPDLHYNRGTINKFLENYQEACDDYTNAMRLDPMQQLPSKDKIADITRHVVRLAELVDKRGKLEQKRLDEITDSLPSVLPESMDGLQFQCFKNLKEGTNKGTAIVLKMVVYAARHNDPPGNFLCVDKEGSMVVLSLYHVDEASYGKMGSNDVFTIREPLVKQVVFNQGGKTLSYYCIQVFSSDLFINGSNSSGRFAHATSSFSSVTSV
jgi:hypothetical protein